MHSDAFGCIRMYLDAFECVRTPSENFKIFWRKIGFSVFLLPPVHLLSTSWYFSYRLGLDIIEKGNKVAYADKKKLAFEVNAKSSSKRTSSQDRNGCQIEIETDVITITGN